MMVVEGADHARELVGRELGVSRWLTVDQELVDRFAETTGDHQWIHVDPERARTSVFGTTIAHGLLTLSLGPRLVEEVFALEGFSMSLNYGYDKVRFPSPLPTGSRVRVHATLVSVDDVDGGIQIVVRHLFERDGLEKPACVADAVSRWLR